MYIYGASGHGKVVFYSSLDCSKNIIAFIDDAPNGKFCGLPVFLPSEIKGFEALSLHFAIGNNQIRQHLQTKWQQRGIILETIIHPRSTCYQSAQINLGSFLAAGSVIGPDSIIGLGCIINHSAIVDHDCKLGDFCHIAPSATLGGSVTLGAQCLVGANAVILPNLTIGRYVTIGAGAVVTRDIPDGITVVGCPAHPI